MVKKLISLVVPVFNEEKNVVLCYKEIAKQTKRLTDYDFNFIFVNDGSRDASQSKLAAVAKKDKRVKVIEFVRNFGKEIAVTAGIHSAQGDAVIMLDADLQHPVNLLPEFIKKWENGAEVVVGVREYDVCFPLYRRAASALFYRVINKISETKIIPRGTDYQLLDRVVIDELNRFTERNRITRGLVSWLGFRTDYVYFQANERQQGAATYSITKLFRLATDSFVSLSLFPLKLAGYLGMYISGLAGILGLFMVVNEFIIDDPLSLNFSGPAILGVAVLFITGIILSSLGLVALYIGAIHTEVINRPIYVVRRSQE